MADQKTWKFNLGDRVALMDSGEEGTIIGRSEFSNGGLDNYFVRYVASGGGQTEAWWTGDALDAVA